MKSGNIRILIFLLATCLLPGVSKAEGISRAQALQVAGHFLKQQSRYYQAVPGHAIARADTLQEAGVPLLYLVSLKDNAGLILVAADDRVRPVLGYTRKGSWGSHSLPPQFEGLLNHYKQQIRGITSGPAEASAAIREQWDQYLEGSMQAEKGLLGVAPLLQTTWDQGEHYNDSCPEDPNAWFNGRVPTGCVATAIAQIMKYHAYPATGSGWHTYLHPDYGNLTATFSNTSYAWNAMPDNLVSTNPAVAQLMYHCGVGVEMNYGPFASGAPSFNAAVALIHFFNYAGSTRLVSRSDYSDPAWISLLKGELDNQRACYYAGYGSVGHAFVLDGYDNNDFFHFNWGWSGWYDGFFHVNNLDPGNNTFNDYQEAIIGISPGIPQACSGTALLTEPRASVNDGSYAANYQNNAACQWLIQPGNNPISIELKFLTFNTQANLDLVKVYDGNSTSAPLLGSFSGNALPPVLASSGPVMLLEFITDATVSMQGWSAVYESKYCFPTTTLTAASASFSDGSGNWNYRHNTDCQWLIQQNGYNTIALLFDAFDTELDYDFLDVHDGASLSDPLLGQFSGDALPPAVVSSGNALLLHFYSDAGVSGQGWEVHYTTIVSTPETRQPAALSLFPNPAAETVYLNFPGINTGYSSLVQVFDTRGKLVLQQAVTAGEKQTRLLVNSLLPGYYVLRLLNHDHCLHAGFIVD